MNDLTSSNRGFFGHPGGLSTLFFTEIWERFSFYGMKAMLFLFIVAGVILLAFTPVIQKRMMGDVR